MLVRVNLILNIKVFFNVWVLSFYKFNIHPIFTNLILFSTKIFIVFNNLIYTCTYVVVFIIIELSWINF